jgi:type II secretory pathway pseudopilin PulG
MKKSTVAILVALVVLAAGVLLVHQNLRTAQERPTVQRQVSRQRLQQFAEALGAYRQAHGAWPDSLLQVVREARLGFGANAVRGAGIYRYRKPPAGTADDYVVMWSDTNHAGVKAGQPWGGEGQVAAADVPPVAYILNAGLKVEELGLDEFVRRAPAPTPP